MVDRKFNRRSTHIALVGILALCLLLGILRAAVFAAETETHRRVFDQAELLSRGEQVLLEEQLTDLQERYGEDIIILTTADREGKATRDLAADFYDELYPEKTASGAIILLYYPGIPGQNEINLVTTGHLIDVVTDYDEERVYDAAMSGLETGNFYQALTDMTTKLEQLMERGVVAGHRRVAEAEPNSLSTVEAVISGVAALLTGGTYQRSIRSSYKAKPRSLSYALSSNSLLSLAPISDQLIKSSVRYVPRPQPQTYSGGGSSRHTTTTFTGSSGRTHGGGGGRKF